MKQTPNYNLPQFEGLDKFTKEDFNDAFTKIDTGISDIQETINNSSGDTLIIANEIVQARKGEINLPKKIEKIDENITKVNSQLEHIDYKKINKLDQYKNIEASRLYRSIDDNISSNGSFMQGGTYIKDNKVIFALADVNTPNTDIVKLVEVNIDSGEKIREKTLVLGHANSLTYNSEKNVLISATLYKFIDGIKTYVNELVEIDYNNLSIVKTINLNVTENVSGVAYDKSKNKVYVMLDPFIVAICDPMSYEINERIALNVPKKIKTFVRQSFEIWNNFIYMCGYTHNYISVYDMKGNNTQNYYFPDYIDHIHKTGELEDITSLGDGRFLMFSACNISNMYNVNSISEFDFVKQVASGAPYAFVNPDGPTKVYVDINSTTNNPDGTIQRPFKQLNETILSIASPLFSNVEVMLSPGVYDWTYIGECRGKISIYGNTEDNTEVKGMFLNSSDVVLEKVKILESTSTRYRGLISCYGANLNVNSVKLNTTDIGIYANNGSSIRVRNLTELNEDESVKTIYGVNRSTISIQKTASNIVKAYVDNTSQLLPHLLIYNNSTNSYLNNIPIPKWCEEILNNNSIKYFEILGGIKVSDNHPSYVVTRTLTSAYSNISLCFTRVSGNKTYISTLNYILETIGGIKYLVPNTGYLTIIDSSAEVPIITNKTMQGNELGSIYVNRIYLTN